MRVPKWVLETTINVCNGSANKSDSTALLEWARGELSGENERREAAAQWLDSADWSVRAWRLFEELGKVKHFGKSPQTMGDLRALNPADLLKVRGYGRKTIKEISRALDDAGIGWPKDRNGWPISG